MKCYWNLLLWTTNNLTELKVWGPFWEWNFSFVADHSLGFKVRGLYFKWKQPVGYFLMTGTVNPSKLQSLVWFCCEKLEKIGLCIKVLVCDQGPNDRSFLHKLENVLAENHACVTTRKCFSSSKNVRNNFMESNYEYGVNVLFTPTLLSQVLCNTWKCFLCTVWWNHIPERLAKDIVQVYWKRSDRFA